MTESINEEAKAFLDSRLELGLRKYGQPLGPEFR